MSGYSLGGWLSVKHVVHFLPTGTLVLVLFCTLVQLKKALLGPKRFACW